MRQGHSSRQRTRRPSAAMIVAVVALIASLGGSAVADQLARHPGKRHPGKRHSGKRHVPKNSVGTRQLKRKAVRSSKIRNNAVNGRKVANGSLTGADINVAALGTVPSATVGARAANANTVTGHAAACPPATVLIRGVCFDAAPNGPVKSVQSASDGCAAKGGYLPTALQLYSVRGIINLGSGGSDSRFTDTYYANTAGGNYRTILVDSSGAMTERSFDTTARYTCAYQLVR